MAGITPKKDPTASEAMFFFAIVKHTKNKADIDWAAVANEQGFKNAEVAKVRFGQVKRKLGINEPAGPRTPSKAGVAAGRVTKTPTKRSTPKTKTQLKLEENDGEEGHETATGAGIPSPSTPSTSPKKEAKTEGQSDAEDYVDPAEFMDI
ncbi:hypothetical protein LIA77_03132 [Sarocladium implicatum]|nr:hypothetical protein LIA77_03132 [Sarocladium implicatum]